MPKGFAEGIVIRRGLVLCERGAGHGIPGTATDTNDCLCGTEKGGSVLCDAGKISRYCVECEKNRQATRVTEGVAALTVYGIGLCGDGSFLYRCFRALSEEEILPYTVFMSDLAVTFALPEAQADRGKRRLCSLLSFYA